MLLSLSQCSYVDSSFKNCNTFNKIRNQVMFLTPCERDLYSTSMLNKAIIGWNLLVWKVTLYQNMANMITPMIGSVVVNIIHDYMTT